MTEGHLAALKTVAPELRGLIDQPLESLDMALAGLPTPPAPIRVDAPEQLGPDALRQRAAGLTVDI